MHRIVLSLLALTLVSTSSFAHDDHRDAKKRLERRLRHAALRACDAAVRFDGAPRGPCRIGRVKRRALTEDVAHYSFRLRVGRSRREVVRVHRVVRERRPFRPVRTDQALLMVHGDVWPFDAAFLTPLRSTSAEHPRALPLFLAENGLDVWGIDLRWTLVPGDTTDFAFLADWGISTDIGDIAVALGVARRVRSFTRGRESIHLLGWSRGGLLGYAYLNAESQLPRRRRNVRGFLPVDIYIKTDAEDRRRAACARRDTQQATFDAGTFQDGSGQFVLTLADLAATAPDDASPFFAGLTNLQAALSFGAATYRFFPPDLEFVPFYHFNGAAFDGDDNPTDLVFTESGVYLDLLGGAAPVEPVKLLLEGEQLMCDEDDVPFDDHLSDVTVPVLYVGAGGGFGDFGVYSTTLLGSTDVDSHVVSTLPPEDRALDVGHADIFSARDAEPLFWHAILDWIEAH